MPRAGRSRSRRRSTPPRCWGRTRGTPPRAGPPASCSARAPASAADAAAITLATVNVLPEPVTPSRICSRWPLIPRSSASIAAAGHRPVERRESTRGRACPQSTRAAETTLGRQGRRVDLRQARRDRIPGLLGAHRRTASLPDLRATRRVPEQIRDRTAQRGHISGANQHAATRPRRAARRRHSRPPACPRIAPRARPCRAPRTATA